MITELLLSGWDSLLNYLSAHVLLCLIPAFFLSGAFNALIPKNAILKYLGKGKKFSTKALAYLFAALSGLLLEVCSCTILPLFAGIWKKGAGFGPAITFLFAGPGVTLLSTPLTATIFGWKFALIKLGLSLVIAVLIGVIMEILFDRKEKINENFLKVEKTKTKRKSYQSILFFASLTLIMIFGTAPIDLSLQLILVGISTILTAIFSFKFYSKIERNEWMKESFGFVKMIFPILLVGVFISGAIMPLIPESLIVSLAGTNTLSANLFAVLFGTIAYFPTLLEVPIAKLFLDLGMNIGPLMSYLIADPAVSIQTLLVINSIIKTKKTITYTVLILVLSALSGWIYGMLV